MKDLQTFKKEVLKDPEVKREYERLAPRYAVISELIAARLKNGITQKELGQKLHTKQSVISRLESGNTNPSIGFLEKIASVMGHKLIVEIQSA